MPECKECKSYCKLFVVGRDVLFATCDNKKSKMYRKIIFAEESCELFKKEDYK